MVEPYQRNTRLRPRDFAVLGAAGALLVAAMVFLLIVVTGKDAAKPTAVAQVTAASAAPTSVVSSSGAAGPAPILDADGGMTYVIPKGTWDRKAAGEKVAVIPEVVTVKVGQRLTIRNDDTGAHIAGPFFVGPGESSTYKFSEPKVIQGECTIHPAGRFEIDVVAA
jgi:hypothetical protein